MELAGLRVHQVGEELVCVTAEQRVRQRHIPPVKVDQVQAHQEHGKRPDQLAYGVRGELAGEQIAVRQRKPQVLGDQAGGQRLTVRIHAVGDHRHRHHARHT